MFKETLANILKSMHISLHLYRYPHYSGSEVIESLGEQRELSIPEHSIPILYQGGSVIVKQKGGQNTVESRKNKFSIEVFLSPEDTADGEFFWDDGFSNRNLIFNSLHYVSSTYHQCINMFIWFKTFQFQRRLFNSINIVLKFLKMSYQ
jgi:hypothetical protein